MMEKWHDGMIEFVRTIKKVSALQMEYFRNFRKFCGFFKNFNRNWHFLAIFGHF